MLDKVISKHVDMMNGLIARRYRFLLLALIGMIIIPSFFEGESYQGFLSLIFRIAVMFTGIHAVLESEKQLKIGVFLGAVLILINSFGVFNASATLNFYFSFILYTFFYLFLAFRLMRMILRAENVTTGVLYAAVNVYLLLGIIGGYLFMLIERATPGSLNNLALEQLGNPTPFFYFSFITLSTLGYGDISPAIPASRSVAMVLSTSGPLYLTILVALLVSRFENSNINKGGEESPERLR